MSEKKAKNETVQHGKGSARNWTETNPNHSPFIRRFLDTIGTGSVRQFALKAGLSPTTLIQLISRNGEPTLSTLVAIARAANVSIDWLATGTGERSREPTLTSPHQGSTLTEEDMDLLLDCYAAGELILQDHNMTATHEEKKAATIKMFHRQKAGGRSLAPGVLVKRTLDSHKNQA